MANAFSAILATATDSAQIVAQEPAGFIDAVDFRPDLAGATLNTTVNLGVVTETTGRDWSPSVSPTLADSTEQNVPLTLTQAKEEVFHLTGEQIRGLNLGNLTAQKYVQTKLAQGMRALRNRIDGYIAGKAKAGASRACGTPGTTPFASTMDLTATLRRILEENGAPLSDLSLVLSTPAAENARKLLGSVTAAAGSLAAESVRAGSLPQHNGMQLRISSQLTTHTKGTGASYTATGAAAATSLALAAGSGTVLAGDILTITGLADPVVAAAALSGGSVAINRPGLRSAVSGAAVAVGNNYMPNIALHRSAIVAVVRPPEQAQLDGVPMPFMADTVVDPVSGLPYGLFMQAFDGGVHVSVRAIYDAVAVNTHAIALLAG